MEANSEYSIVELLTLTNYILRRPQNFAKSSTYFWLYVLQVVKGKVKISQNFVASSEYTNFNVQDVDTAG